jgi:hypothetical protein
MSQPIIPPINKTIQQNYSHMNIKCIDVVLFTSARFIVDVYDSSFNRINDFNLIMEGEDYQNWKGDDAYVSEWVNRQLQNL